MKAGEGNDMLCCQELLGQILSELELATIHRVAPESGHANSHLATTGFALQFHLFQLTQLHSSRSTPLPACTFLDKCPRPTMSCVWHGCVIRCSACEQASGVDIASQLYWVSLLLEAGLPVGSVLTCHFMYYT